MCLRGSKENKGIFSQWQVLQTGSSWTTSTPRSHLGNAAITLGPIIKHICKPHWDPAVLLGSTPVDFDMTKLWLYKKMNESLRKSKSYAHEEVFINLSSFQCLLWYKAATSKREKKQQKLQNGTSTLSHKHYRDQPFIPISSHKFLLHQLMV